MPVYPRTLADGKTKRYDATNIVNGKRDKKTFIRKGDAEAYDADVKRRMQLGPLAASVIDSKMTLVEFFEGDYWPRYAIPSLAEDTRRRYMEIWGAHLCDRVGGYQLCAFNPNIIEDAIGELKSSGAATQRKALMLLQGVFRRAHRRGLVPENPCLAVDKPDQPTTKPPRPLPPIAIERIRAAMMAMWQSEKRGPGRAADEIRWWRVRNATMVSMLGYGGFRPSEDRAVRWGAIEGRTLHIVATKTNKARQVEILGPLVQDLAEWRMVCGRPGPKDLIIPTFDGDEWKRHDWNNWRRRVYQPAARAAGIDGDLTPYRLRASFVSLLLWAGEDLAYIAEQAGHSVATLAKHYAGAMRELRDQPRVPAAEAIRRARAEIADHMVTIAKADRSGGN
jgi:integrase